MAHPIELSPLLAGSKCMLIEDAIPKSVRHHGKLMNDLRLQTTATKDENLIIDSKAQKSAERRVKSLHLHSSLDAYCNLDLDFSLDFFGPESSLLGWRKARAFRHVSDGCVSRQPNSRPKGYKFRRVDLSVDGNWDDSGPTSIPTASLNSLVSRSQSPETEVYHDPTNSSNWDPIQHSSVRSSNHSPLVETEASNSLFSKQNNALYPFSPRPLGSPLRPGQRSSSSRSFTPRQIPDRFIPCRGPQISRESLELGRLPESLDSQERRSGSRRFVPDPFTRRTRTTATTALRMREHPHSQTNSPQSPSPHTRANSVIGLHHGFLNSTPRRVSQGAVWNVGGSVALNESVLGVANGRGGVLTSGTNAPLYFADFLNHTDPENEMEAHERRVALAMDVDISARILSPASASAYVESPFQRQRLNVWKDNEWIKEGSIMLLDAPSLRDDYYCSLLAYSPTAKCLAVGLGGYVYLWNESGTTESPTSLNSPTSGHVTSLSFSSKEGGKAILAVGRASGQVLLYSPLDMEPRFDSNQPHAVCCVSFRPKPVRRTSTRDGTSFVETEDLLVGDDVGHVYYYFIEWPNPTERDLFNWPGSLNLVARVTLHTQQICGLSWSHDGEYFASGGNDNFCYLFETNKVLLSALSDTSSDPISSSQPQNGSVGTVTRHSVDMSGSPSFRIISGTSFKHRFSLAAAVKAIAFCPWQRALLAVGGGSNDRCIHFFHTLSGAPLATIDCHAQVTSLLWSITRREIAATFGFAQPEHQYRIAVFKWPTCEVVVKIPWADEHRALYAIPYPGGPNVGREHFHRQNSTARQHSSSLNPSRDRRREGGVWWSRTEEEGCLCVATSDCSIKFHEIWADDKRATGEKSGMLGGSDILDLMQDIQKDSGPVIR